MTAFGALFPQQEMCSAHYLLYAGTASHFCFLGQASKRSKIILLIPHSALLVLCLVRPSLALLTAHHPACAQSPVLQKALGQNRKRHHQEDHRHRACGTCFHRQSIWAKAGTLGLSCTMGESRTVWEVKVKVMFLCMILYLAAPFYGQPIVCPGQCVQRADARLDSDSFCDQKHV